MLTTKRNRVFMLALTISLGASHAALCQVPAGYFTDVVPVLADPLYGDGVPTVTEDGLTMVFTHGALEPRRPSNIGSYDMYMATRANVGEPFGNVVNLGANVNTTGWDVTGSLSPNGQTLYFYRRDTASDDSCVGFVGSGLADFRVAGWSRTQLWLVWNEYTRRGLGDLAVFQQRYQTGSDRYDTFTPSADGDLLAVADGACGLPGQ